MNIVTQNQRSVFLQKHFYSPLFDLVVFNIADNLIEDYTGGYWDYVELENAAFLKLSGAQFFKVRNIFSGEVVEVDATLAGMVVTSFSVLSQIEKGVMGLIPLHDNLNHAIAEYCSNTNRMDAWMALMD
jgi:hypothetical protein